MFKKVIEKYLKNKKCVEKVSMQPVEEKQDFDINIFKSKNIFMLEVSDYVTIVDYVERMKEVDQYNLLDLLGNALLWNSRRQKVNKGTYFVIIHDGYLYNIFLGEDSMGIDERIKVGDNTHERIIFLNNNGDYNYTSFKHDKVGNTFYTMYYFKKGFPIPALELKKEDACQEINEILCNMELVPGIENIIDVNIFRNNVLDDMVPKGDGVSLKKYILI